MSPGVQASLLVGAPGSGSETKSFYFQKKDLDYSVVALMKEEKYLPTETQNMSSFISVSLSTMPSMIQDSLRIGCSA